MNSNAVRIVVPLASDIDGCWRALGTKVVPTANCGFAAGVKQAKGVAGPDLPRATNGFRRGQNRQCWGLNVAAPIVSRQAVREAAVEVALLNPYR